MALVMPFWPGRIDGGLGKHLPRPCQIKAEKCPHKQRRDESHVVTRCCNQML